MCEFVSQQLLTARTRRVRQAVTEEDVVSGRERFGLDSFVKFGRPRPRMHANSAEVGTER
jgi:hypothetical protein